MNYRNLEYASLKFGSILHYQPGSLIFDSVRKMEFTLQLMIPMETTLLPFSVDLIIIWTGIINLEERFGFLWNWKTEEVLDSSY